MVVVVMMIEVLARLGTIVLSAFQRNSAARAEAMAFAVACAACGTNQADRGDAGNLNVLDRFFSVRFQRQLAQRVKSGCKRRFARLRMTHLLVKAGEKFCH